MDVNNIHVTQNLLILFLISVTSDIVYRKFLLTCLSNVLELIHKRFWEKPLQQKELKTW